MLTVADNCTKCGLCAQDCPIGIIALREGGPKLLAPQMCINCGHCVAICPVAALDHTHSPLAQQTTLEKFPVLDAPSAAMFLRSRRSIRCYKPAPVASEKLLELLNIARFAPSGGNSQGLSYLIVSDRKLLTEITEATINWLETLIKDKVPWIKPYTGIVAVYRRTKHDVILRDAPHLIFATAPKEMTVAAASARYALGYAELYAPSLGLGTCWAGFVEMFAQMGEGKLDRLVGLSPELAIYGAIMAGYPCYTYKRLPDRNPLQVDWR